MKVLTKYFGEIEISKDNIITFNDGVYGFEKYRKYIVIDIENNKNFKCLQSIEEEYIAFIITNPWNFFKGYEIDIPDDELENLNIVEIEDMEIQTIVTVPKDMKKMTVNLQAPLILNIKNKIAKQIILNNNNYKTKHYINEMESESHASAL